MSEVPLPSGLLEKLLSDGVSLLTNKPLALPSSEKSVWTGVRRIHGTEPEKVAVLYSRKNRQRWTWNFKREREVLQQLNDEASKHLGKCHILKLHAAYDEAPDQGSCMVMEAVQPIGWDLMSVLRLYTQTDRVMPVIEWQQYIVHVTQGLSYLHSIGWIHTDLRAEQVLVGTGPTGNPLGKLIDFGFALKVGEQFPKDRLRNFFHAPESKYPGTASAKIDVYGIGVIMYVCVMGVQMDDPLGHSYFVQHWLDDQHFEVRNIESKDRRFQEAFKNMLSKNPWERWSIDDLLQEPFVRPAFLDATIAEPANSTSLSGLELQAAPTVESLLILNSRVRPNVGCCIVKAQKSWIDKTIGELDFKVDTTLLIMLIRRLNGEFVACPAGMTVIEEGDQLIVVGDRPGGPSEELSTKQKILNLGAKQIPPDQVKPFFGEYDEFPFPANCYGAVLGSTRFCTWAGQPALSLRPDFGINLVSIIKANGSLIGPTELSPSTVVEPGDSGLVCRVPLPSGFSQSSLTEAMYQKLACATLPTADESVLGSVSIPVMPKSGSFSERVELLLRREDQTTKRFEELSQQLSESHDREAQMQATIKSLEARINNLETNGKRKGQSKGKQSSSETRSKLQAGGRHKGGGKGKGKGKANRKGKSKGKPSEM